MESVVIALLIVIAAHLPLLWALVRREPIIHVHVYVNDPDEPDRPDEEMFECEVCGRIGGAPVCIACGSPANRVEDGDGEADGRP